MARKTVILAYSGKIAPHVMRRRSGRFRLFNTRHLARPIASNAIRLRRVITWNILRWSRNESLVSKTHWSSSVTSAIRQLPGTTSKAWASISTTESNTGMREKLPQPHQQWPLMSIQAVIVTIIVLAALAFAVRGMVRKTSAFNPG